MPTRSYYFPNNFTHLERILLTDYEDHQLSDLAFFRERGVAPIPSPGSLSILLGISPKIIFSIRKYPKRNYRSFSILKKDGTRREIDTPRTYLKVVQWWILDNILHKIPLPEYVFGFVPGRSAIQNATFHAKTKHVLNVDIKDFFPSISKGQVVTIFTSIGYSVPVAEMLADLCCYNDRVPQGAPTSPALANLVLSNLDHELHHLAKATGCKYSRYADDLTFSSERRIEMSFFEAVKSAVRRYGFSLKSSKTRFSGRGNRMEVTGVVINDTLQPPRKWRKNTRAKIHTLKNASRITRKQVSYLQAIVGMTGQFPDSKQLQRLSEQASEVLESKLSTVIGKGTNPKLPNNLTLKQALVLMHLNNRTSNADIAYNLATSESAVKSRLQEAFKKIGAADRYQAAKWSSENL
ncbi:retron St85 family RNA-directed DNA polymerase [Thalassospira sp.]|uniref:retron St85 family RNA-directed DNA polymerase n=1 Tax=Thalassospira sp. TaxID=1912094 RepID=UPI00311DE254